MFGVRVVYIIHLATHVAKNINTQGYLCDFLSEAPLKLTLTSALAVS